MPRPRLRPGEYGTVHTLRGPDGWIADTRYRRVDGQVRRARARGRTKSEAESRLREAVARKVGDLATLGLSPDSTVAELAAVHLAAEAKRDLAPNTIREIRNVVGLHIVPALGGLTLRECTTPIVEHALQELARAKAPQAKKMRWVLSGMFRRAVRLGAAPASPVLASTPVRVASAPVRALSLEDLMAVRAVVRSRPEPSRNRRSGAAAADVLEFLVATGCRAAEALGLAWEDVHLEDTIPWVRVHRQVVRVEGAGLARTPTKERDTRDLWLPNATVAVLSRLRDGAAGPLVFPSATGGLRDPRNMRHIWDRALEGTEWEWVTQKVIRKTVATYLADMLGSKEAADQLGHADDRVTRAHYIEEHRQVLRHAPVEDLTGEVAD